MRERIAAAVDKLEAELASREEAAPPEGGDPEVAAAKEALEKGKAVVKEASE